MGQRDALQRVARALVDPCLDCTVLHVLGLGLGGCLHLHDAPARAARQQHVLPHQHPIVLQGGLEHRLVPRPPQQSGGELQGLAEPGFVGDQLAAPLAVDLDGDVPHLVAKLEGHLRRGRIHRQLRPMHLEMHAPGALQRGHEAGFGQPGHVRSIPQPGGFHRLRHAGRGARLTGRRRTAARRAGRKVRCSPPALRAGRWPRCVHGP